MTMMSVAQAAATRPLSRLDTRVGWWDSITGGGTVLGSVTMLHGAPGAGKSTALAQVAGGVPGSLYVSLEEPLSAVAERCRRLGVSTMLSDDLADLGHARGLAIVDSIQMTGDALDTVHAVVEHARSSGTAVVLVCHETKAGQHVGRRTIEHLVDVSLMLTRQPRAVVCEKNRHGPAGVYFPLRMTERGLGYGDMS